MNKTTLLGTSLAIIVVVGVGAYALTRPAAPPALSPLQLAASAFPELAGATSTPSATAGVGVAALAPPRTAPAGSKEYRNTQYRFSFFYPDDLTQSSYDEGGGATTVVFQNPGEALGFQIFIVPYTNAQITTQRFQEDEPSGVRDSVSATAIDGVQAVSFYGSSPSLGDTAEIWFIHNGYLFEVTTLKTSASWLSSIMATWQFI